MEDHEYWTNRPIDILDSIKKQIAGHKLKAGDVLSIRFVEKVEVHLNDPAFDRVFPDAERIARYSKEYPVEKFVIVEGVRYYAIYSKEV
jgi:hypothetical protein